MIYEIAPSQKSTARNKKTEDASQESIAAIQNKYAASLNSI